MHVLITRPEADAAELKARVEGLGHRASIGPVLAIVPTGVAVPLDGAQALIATSRNGLMGTRSGACDLPFFAVGPATAEKARGLGFSRVLEGPGTARELAPFIAAALTPEGGDLVHLAGDSLAFDLKGALEARGFSVRQPIVYRSEVVENLSAETVATIRSGDLNGVILMSPRAGRIFAELAAKNGLREASRRLIFFCLSGAVAQALTPLGPVDVRVADAPNLHELLALLARVTPDSP